MANPQDKPVAVVGAGLIGRLLAWRLLQQGRKVTLLDKDLSGNQSAGLIAAAMISPISEAMVADTRLYYDGKKNIPLWQSWLKELNQKSSDPVDYQFDGSLVVAHPQDKALFDRFALKLNQQAIDPQDYDTINQTDILSSEPELTHFQQAIRLFPEGYIDNAALFSRLKSVIDQLGGRWVHQSINIIEKELSTNDFSFIVDCRGVGAKPENPQLRGVRGEIIRVRAPEVSIQRPVRFLHPRYQLYIVPRPNKEYVIGATQVESEDNRQVTVRSALELLSALYSLHTGFSEAEILSLSARCRPAFLDNLPKIQRTNFGLSLNGFFRHGYLLSPTLVEEAVTIINNKN